MDPDYGEALEKLFGLGLLLAESMDRGLAERGLTRSRAELLLRLHQHRGEGLTQRELSEILQCTPRNVTGLVDALEADGFVKRSAHPTDRRATLVLLTERGRIAAAQMQTEYQGLGTLLFSDLDPTALTSFVAVLDQVLARLTGGPTGDPNAPPNETH
jgi:DNA-binding MarR family transcriptional regulator